MRNISAWAIRHPVTPIVLFVVLFFLGVVAFVRLPINLDPDVSFPVVNVNVTQPGAAPTELETQIAQKVEGSISNIGNVRNITTFIVEGQVNIFTEFLIGTAPIDFLTEFGSSAVAGQWSFWLAPAPSSVCSTVSRTTAGSSALP